MHLHRFHTYPVDMDVPGDILKVKDLLRTSLTDTSPVVCISDAGQRWYIRSIPGCSSGVDGYGSVA